MAPSLLRREIMPFVLQFAALMVLVAVGDRLLHHFGLGWVGRYLGIPGTLLIVFSLLYSMRKRKLITTGSPRVLLVLHEMSAWVGTMMVLVHAGYHFDALLPWLATFAMVVNVMSGLIGRYLLDRSRRHLAEAKAVFNRHGLSKKETERELFWDAVSYDLMAKWRVIHFPISFAFAVLALGHILSVFLFWEWR